MNTKYALGQVIKHQGDPDGDFGVIVGISVTSQGVSYTIELDEFDRNTRQLVKAVKHVFEEDAVLKTEPEQPTGEVQVNE